MKFPILTLLTVILTTATASPVTSLSPRAITFADFTGFSVSCTTTTCSYNTAILLSDATSLTCTHTTTGATIPVNSGFWSCSAENIWLRFNKLPVPPAAYRIVLTDARVAGSPVTVDYFSPVADWPGDAGYSGPSSFRAD
ncbi:hypothetical protein QBC47DRAFT_440167 [Echria macrotheca]|uniref:Uncharacterized protein n=1 Tax=Echria macrotheca TaxID=438768 RepID=A0AAJ0B141_9PEZI|nr:hypothetical protein QBC47DRAFT_440167 [Echria macrotheca]